MSKYDSYVGSLKSAAVKMGAQLVFKHLVAHVPFLALPIIGPIVSSIIYKLIEILIQETEFGAFFLYVDTRTSQQGRAFQEAALNNQLIQKTGTPEEKALAEKELVDRFRDFAKFSS